MKKNGYFDLKCEVFQNSVFRILTLSVVRLMKCRNMVIFMVCDIFWCFRFGTWDDISRVRWI